MKITMLPKKRKGKKEVETTKWRGNRPLPGEPCSVERWPSKCKAGSSTVGGKKKEKFASKIHSLVTKKKTNPVKNTELPSYYSSNYKTGQHVGMELDPGLPECHCKSLEVTLTLKSTKHKIFENRDVKLY